MIKYGGSSRTCVSGNEAGERRKGECQRECYNCGHHKYHSLLRFNVVN